MDHLSELFKALQVEGEIYFHSEFTAPWGFSQLADDGAIFHVIKQGHCWLRLVEENQLIALNKGDLVIIPGAFEHELLDDPTSATLPLKPFLKSYNLGESDGLVRYGGGGAATWVICGEFHLTASGPYPVFSFLPPLIHIKSQQEKMPSWLETTLKYLDAEIGKKAPGNEIIISRLLDVFFIEVLRYWLNQQPGQKKGLLGAMSDPQLGLALQKIHSQPEQPWTVNELARIAGMSRAAFAAHFNELIGEPPLTYLTHWRMQMAAHWLYQDKMTIEKVAEKSGYASVAAFARTFKRYMGITPGAYRAKEAENLG